jgi:phosphoribosylamine--glycine ligase
VCKYLVPEGYPTNSVKHKVVTVNQELLDALQLDENYNGVEVFYASVYEDKNTGELKLGGSRAIGVVGIHDDFKEAKKLADKAIEAFTGPLFYRKDIGSEELLEARMAMVA